MDTSRLYVTWRHPEGRIHPVGVLTQRVSAGATSYRFAYLKHTESLDGFTGLPGLPNLHEVHENDELFPVFRKRQMPRKRPDYPEYVRNLGLAADTDPFVVMGRSEGQKVTDRIELFPPPQRTSQGCLTTLFFARGIRHEPTASDNVAMLSAGDRLLLVDEPNNPVNQLAVQINDQDDGRIGWVPDYLVDTIHELRDLTDEDLIKVTAEHINSPSVAPYMRLLCRLTAPWPDGYQPLSGPEFQAISS